MTLQRDTDHERKGVSTPARMTMSQVVSPKYAAGLLSELWFPKVIAEVDDAYVKVAKLHGSLAWHSHDDADELFFILKGRLQIEMPDRVVELNEGDLFVVPRGVRHNPSASEECHVLFIERKSMKHTGDVTTEKTRSIDDQLSNTAITPRDLIHLRGRLAET